MPNWEVRERNELGSCSFLFLDRLDIEAQRSHSGTCSNGDAFVFGHETAPLFIWKNGRVS